MHRRNTEESLNMKWQHSDAVSKSQVLYPFQLLQILNRLRLVNRTLCTTYSNQQNFLIFGCHHFGNKAFVRSLHEIINWTTYKAYSYISSLSEYD